MDWLRFLQSNDSARRGEKSRGLCRAGELFAINFVKNENVLKSDENCHHLWSVTLEEIIDERIERGGLVS